MRCSCDGRLQKRTGDCLFYCLQRLVVSSCSTNTNMCDTLVCHDGLYVCEIQIDQCRQIDQVSNTLYCLLQYFICFLQCLRHGSSAVHDLQKLIVRNHDQRIYGSFQLLDTCQCIVHSLLCFKTERLGHNTNRQDSHLFSCSCQNRSCTGSGSATHTTGYKYHVCTLDCFFELFNTLFCRLFTDLRLCTCSQSFGQLLADLDRRRSLAELQCLLVRVHTDKFYSADLFLYHSIYSIISCTTNADHNDPCSCFCFIRHDFQQGYILLQIALSHAILHYFIS